jgi:hypothetical protein
MAGGIEFRMYAQHVADHMAALGYVPVNDPDHRRPHRQLRLRGRHRPRARAFERLFLIPGGARGTATATARYAYRGYYGAYSPWGWGWNSSWYNDVHSYTIYTSGIEMKIDRRADNQRLFEGRAQAISTSNHLQWLVPNLVDAMFTGFPGNSGETVRISIAPENQVVQRSPN